MRRRQHAGDCTNSGAPAARRLSHGVRLLLHGYEIAGGLGVKLAHPNREVYVLVGDGSYLMMAGNHHAVQEGCKLNIVLLDNHGFSSTVDSAAAVVTMEWAPSIGIAKMKRKYDGDLLPVDFEANAASLGALTCRARTGVELKAALIATRKQSRTS